MIEWPKHQVISIPTGRVAKSLHIVPVSGLNMNGLVIIDTQNDFMNIDVTLGDLIQWSADKYIIRTVEKIVLVSREDLPMYLGIHSVLDAKIAGILSGSFPETT